jgi:signal transduction histidine kinase
MQQDQPVMPERPRILVVDDDPDVLASLTDELSERYVVTSASDGESALRCLNERHFDAIISDVRMPGMSGVEVVRHAHRLDTDIVRILLTGYSDENARSEALAPSGAYKLGKPWGEELDIVLQHALEQRQAIHRSRADLHAERQVREQTEQAIARHSKMAALGTLTAGVAHELRSPLTCLNANIEALLDLLRQLDPAFEALKAMASDYSSLPGGQSDQLREMLVRHPIAMAHQDLKAIGQESIQSVHRVQEIVDGLRTYSAPARRAQYRQLDVAKCVNRAVSLVSYEYKHHVEVRTTIEPDVAPLSGHEGQIIQVLVNLMLNSIQAMNGNGSIEIRVRRTEAAVALEVEDSGPGVSEENRERLFQPFFTTKLDAQGNGLGLWISREIALRHGGELRCLPRTPPGAVFVLELPINADGPGSERP